MHLPLSVLRPKPARVHCCRSRMKANVVWLPSRTWRTAASHTWFGSSGRRVDVSCICLSGTMHLISLRDRNARAEFFERNSQYKNSLHVAISSARIAYIVHSIKGYFNSCALRLAAGSFVVATPSEAALVVKNKCESESASVAFSDRLSTPTLSPSRE